MNLFDAVKRQIQGFDPMMYIDKVSNFYIFPACIFYYFSAYALFKTLDT